MGRPPKYKTNEEIEIQKKLKAEYMRFYRKKNRKRLAKIQREWRERNPDYMREYSRRNRQKSRQYQREYSRSKKQWLREKAKKSNIWRPAFNKSDVQHSSPEKMEKLIREMFADKRVYV